MRIIAGTYRSRLLTAPAGMATRPTSDRLRETLFDVLGARIQGAAFLDLYAGSGAVGIEALSRGGARTAFVERARGALKALRENLARLGISRVAQVYAMSAARFLRAAEAAQPFDLVFLDPPYEASEEYEAALMLLENAAARWLVEGAVVIAEHRRNQRLKDRYGRLEQTRLLEQGDAALSFYALAVAAGERTR
jgi:16S rRNA (guanine(966)-N(2))-methyltransferase RsmD